MRDRLQISHLILSELKQIDFHSPGIVRKPEVFMVILEGMEVN